MFLWSEQLVYLTKSSHAELEGSKSERNEASTGIGGNVLRFALVEPVRFTHKESYCLSKLRPAFICLTFHFGCQTPLSPKASRDHAPSQASQTSHKNF